MESSNCRFQELGPDVLGAIIQLTTGFTCDRCASTPGPRDLSTLAHLILDRPLSLLVGPLCDYAGPQHVSGHWCVSGESCGDGFSPCLRSLPTALAINGRRETLVRCLGPQRCTEGDVRVRVRFHWVPVKCILPSTLGAGFRSGLRGSRALTVDLQSGSQKPHPSCDALLSPQGTEAALPPGSGTPGTHYPEHRRSEGGTDGPRILAPAQWRNLVQCWAAWGTEEGWLALGVFLEACYILLKAQGSVFPHLIRGLGDAVCYC